MTIENLPISDKLSFDQETHIIRLDTLIVSLVYFGNCVVKQC